MPMVSVPANTLHPPYPMTVDIARATARPVEAVNERLAMNKFNRERAIRPKSLSFLSLLRAKKLNCHKGREVFLKEAGQALALAVNLVSAGAELLAKVLPQEQKERDQRNHDSTQAEA